MKQLWLRIEQETPTELKRSLLRRAEGLCTVAILSPGDLQFASSLKISTASTDSHSDIRLIQHNDHEKSSPTIGTTAVEVVVKDASDEAKVLELIERGAGYVIVQCPNWKVIPLENLIARTRNKSTLLADVSDIGEAKLALEALELGVDGVVFTAKSPEDILEIDRFLRPLQELQLTPAKVVSIRSLGSGVRVCVDTCELMSPGEGMLVGSQSSGLFLVEAEVHRNPHVEPRPFRVNAGPVSSYVLTPSLKTRYLSELKAGDEILIVDRTGKTRKGHVGRTKIERRPMFLVETEVKGRFYSLIVQNAETVRLVSASASKSVTELAAGDEVLVFVEEGGRHFGTLVADELVIER
jgi:3-dehydroquinate synthase II